MYVILLFVVMNSALHISRRVGMADDADSKSVVGNHVWVQVPPPAVKKEQDGSPAPLLMLISDWVSGAYGNRTRGLNNANVTRSQLR